MTVGLVHYVVSHEMEELMNQELREAAEIIHNVLALSPVNTAADVTPTSHSDYEEHLVWQLIDRASGSVLAHSHKAPLTAMQKVVTAGPIPTPDGRWRVISLVFKRDPDHILVVAQSETERGEAQNDAVFYTFIGSLLMILLSMALMNWRMRQELRPLSTLSRDVQAYDPLIPATAPPSAKREELKPIETAIQELGQRLAQRVISERAFTSHAAHALRTPVAGLDVQLAMALKEAPESLRPRLLRAREATTRLGRVMQALLAMFRSGIEPQRKNVCLADLLAALSFNPLVIEVDADVHINVDPDLMTAVLLNLLDNAQRHQAAKVAIVVTRLDEHIHVSVQDDGHGCTGERMHRLRTALQSQDYDSRDGLKGLGLILADLILRAHGGHIKLPTVHQGFCIELIWPEKFLQVV
jgi:signal transduction histidine kinase